MGFILDSGTPTTVLSVSGSMGAWTSIWTPPVALDGFLVMLAQDPSGLTQVGFFDVALGSTPVSILNNGKEIYTNSQQSYRFFPIPVPANTLISVAAEETAGTASDMLVHIIGIPSGSGFFPRCSVIQNLILSGGHNNYGPISSTSPGTLYGTTLEMHAQAINLTGEYVWSGGLSTANISIWGGPSSSTLTKLLGNFFLGLYEGTQSDFSEKLPISLPPSQDLYLLLNSSTSATPYGSLRIFY